jgi:hypothetical protein
MKDGSLYVNAASYYIYMTIMLFPYIDKVFVHNINLILKNDNCNSTRQKAPLLKPIPTFSYNLPSSLPTLTCVVFRQLSYFCVLVRAQSEMQS